jgi:hypothetical protein
MNRDRKFPIQSPAIPSIPWAMIAPHESRARANHGQSLARLAERGGLCPSEALDVLADRPWDGRTFILPRDRDARDRWVAETVAELQSIVLTWEANRP